MTGKYVQISREFSGSYTEAKAALREFTHVKDRQKRKAADSLASLLEPEGKDLAGPMHH